MKKSMLSRLVKTEIGNKKPNIFIKLTSKINKRGVPRTKIPIPAIVCITVSKKINIYKNSKSNMRNCFHILFN